MSETNFSSHQVDPQDIVAWVEKYGDASPAERYADSEMLNLFSARFTCASLGSILAS
jgi:hypothetical protein